MLDRGDVLFGQVTFSLLDNAARCVPTGSLVTVTVRQEAIQ